MSKRCPRRSWDVKMVSDRIIRKKRMKCGIKIEECVNYTSSSNFKGKQLKIHTEEEGLFLIKNIRK